MNKKTLCLLVFSIIAFSFAAAQTFTPEETTINVGSGTPQVSAPWYTFITNWINNQFYFGMRIMYDLFCFGVGYTYVFWFNDGGANFYKCYDSVPRRIKYY